MRNLQYHKVINRKILFTLALALMLITMPTKSQANEISTSEIKASWIYTAIEWLDWKKVSDNNKITICAVGRDKVYMHLKRIEINSNNKKGNRRFTVLNKSTGDDFKECNILYISESEQEYHMNIIDTVSTNHGLITISSISGFAKHGGSIEFVIKKKARLIINLKAIKNAKVGIDDELYSWAETIN